MALGDLAVQKPPVDFFFQCCVLDDLLALIFCIFSPDVGLVLCLVGIIFLSDPIAMELVPNRRACATDHFADVSK